MDVTDSLPVLELKRLLQRYVKKLYSDIKEIEGKEIECQKDVVSLANLLEQRESVANVDVTVLSLVSSFPDIQSRLLVKISGEVNTKLERLKDLIEPLRKHNTVANKARTEVLNIVRKHFKDLDLETLTTGQPTIPPPMVMLDWIDTVERQTREIYHTRMYYLDSIVIQEVVNSQSLISLWCADMPAFISFVKDCEEQSRYFVEEKYV